MIDRKPFENGSNPGREREEAVLRGVSGWLEPSKPWLARRNGISSAFRSRHMGNVGWNTKRLCHPRRAPCRRRDPGSERPSRQAGCGSIRSISCVAW